METADLKKGAKVMYEGQPYLVLETQFVKPGKGQAFIRTKMKNLLTGGVQEKNIRSNEKMEKADVEDLSLQFIYPEGEAFVFMNPATGDQITVQPDVMGSAKDFLIDGADVTVTVYQGNPISIDLPPHIEVEVTFTEPGMKGDTASNVTKPATISTGATVQVPLFIDQGEWIKVDTRTGSYLERVKNPGG